MNALQKCLWTVFLATSLFLRPLEVRSDNVFSVDERDRSIVHNSSGTVFPARYDGFVRLEPQILDNEGSKIALSYSGKGFVRALFTEYVRLRDMDITEYYAASKSAIFSDKQLKISTEETEGLIMSATFAGTARVGKEEMPVASILRITEKYGWLIKTRVTVPFPQENLVTDEQLEEFLAQLPLFYPAIRVQEEIRKPIIVFDQNLNRGLTEVRSAWIAYGMTMSLQMQGYLSRQGTYQGFQMTLERETEARAFLCSYWTEIRASSPGVADKYLDDLLKVTSSGYISEYVYWYYRKDFWKEEPGLRLNEFSSWAAANIQGHIPQTLAKAVITPWKSQASETLQRAKEP